MSDLYGPDVRVPPPVLVLIAVAAAWGLETLYPIDIGPASPAIGGTIIMFAITWLGWALLILMRAGNDPRPDKPDKAFVADGPFRFGRNPIYLSFVLIMAGVALSLGNLWLWLATLAILAVFDRYVVRREEAYLRTRFPDTYPAYAARIRRWV